MSLVNIIVPKYKSVLKTNIKRKNSPLVSSTRIDKAIDIILNSGKYNEKKVLLIQNPYNIAPLTALIVFKTVNPCQVNVKLDDGDIYKQSYEPVCNHIIPVYGLHADSENTISVEIIYKSVIVNNIKITLYTGKIPKCLQNNVSVNKHTDNSASPFTLIFGGSTKYPYAFDETGEIRYFLKKKTKSYGIYPLSKGHFFLLADNICVPTLSNPHSCIMYEMDYLGHVYNEYLILDGVHHDGSEMCPGGNIITISSSLNNSMEDMIIEIDRTSGNVIKILCLGDILCNHPYMNMIDWAHINTVSYLQKDNCILICSRNLHSVIKIDWDTFAIKWIMCDPYIWKDTAYEQFVLKAEPGTPYFYQAHAAYYLDDNMNQIIVYDNHYAKRRPVESFDNSEYSYVRIYTVNEDTGSFSLYTDYPTEKSTIRSNAFTQNDRLLAMNGHHIDDNGGDYGSVCEFDRLSGMLINKYTTKKSFYRGYSFPKELEFEPNTMNNTHLLKGNLPRINTYAGNKQELISSSVEWSEIRDIISARIYNDMILLYCKDHYISHVYYVGKKYVYVHNHNNTVQMKAKIFGNEHYYIVNQTRDIKSDTYTIYIESNNKTYKTKWTFTKK